MAQTIAFGIVSASVASNYRLVGTSVELAVTAASAAVRAMRPSERALAENPLIREELEQMDTEAKLKTVHALILTIQKDRHGEEEMREDDVVGVCLVQVKDVLDSITKTLDALNGELDQHDQRWFSTWRTPDTKHHLIALKAKSTILDKRVDMLLKVCSFVGGAQSAITNSLHGRASAKHGTKHG